MNTKKLTKLLALYLPYILLGLVATNFGEAWRLAEGKELGERIMSMMGTLPAAFANPLPSLHPLDLLIGISCGAGLRLAVYLRSKNAKKYRHGMEYGSARWGTAKDIEPFQAPKFEDNIILTKTERLMMSNRPSDPKNARNKNVLIVGGSGSGKTRFWLKPNLLQMHSSYVVTDPKGSIVVECGNALLKNGYKLKILNTINFSKSMHYNPFSYVHSEKDILKLVTTLMTNTKGDGSGGDPFWEKSERLLLTALIAYLHYRITKLLKSTLFVKLPAIRFHILTSFLVGKLVVLPPFSRGNTAFFKNAEDFLKFLQKFFERTKCARPKSPDGRIGIVSSIQMIRQFIYISVVSPGGGRAFFDKSITVGFCRYAFCFMAATSFSRRFQQ